MKKLEVQDPLEKVNLGDEVNQKQTYVSKLIDDKLQKRIIAPLHKFKDCFVWH